MAQSPKGGLVKKAYIDDAGSEIEENLAVWGCEESCNTVIFQSLSWGRLICILILTPTWCLNTWEDWSKKPFVSAA